MNSLQKKVSDCLSSIELPGGSNLISRDLIRALEVKDGVVRFVIEIKSSEVELFNPIVKHTQKVLEAIDGVSKVSIVLTSQRDAAETSSNSRPPDLKIGKHPDQRVESIKPDSIRHIIAVGSGKGGVGKSTVSVNLAVALAKKGVRVGLLDADIYGPSQPKMLGLTGRPDSPDGKTIIPLSAFGVVVMSIGFMVDPSKAVVWRGPMLQGALQQMLGQVQWGDLDVLIVDLPPGTGDVQLTLCQKAQLSGAIIVSTPQDVSLIDAKKAIDMLNGLKVPVLGLVENMSNYICPKCGHEAEIFGHGGVSAEASKMGLPFWGEIPLDLEIRLSGDAGKPIAAGDNLISEPYARIAQKLIDSVISN
jgi:ATP-binding protein involved in chromosome partitioning